MPIEHIGVGPECEYLLELRPSCVAAFWHVVKVLPEGIPDKLCEQVKSSHYYTAINDVLCCTK